MPLNTVYLGTRAGKFKMASVVVGFFAVAFVSAAFDLQCFSCRCATYTFCTDEKGYFGCVHVWLPKTGLALIILAWLFSLAMLLGSLRPDCSGEPLFLKVDFAGHIVFGVTQLVAFLAVLLWILNQIISYHCFDMKKVVKGKEESLAASCIFFDILYGQSGMIWLGGGFFAVAHSVVLLMIPSILRSEPKIRAVRSNVTPLGMEAQSRQDENSEEERDHEHHHHHHHRHNH